MEIRRLSPQSQQTLKRLDFNQDQAVSASELSRLKGRDGNLMGIAPQDQMTLKTALNQAKSPHTLIVSLVDESENPPGYRPPAPLFGERARPDASAGTKSPVAAPARPVGKPAANDDEDEDDEDSPSSVAAGSPLQLKARTTIAEGENKLGKEVSAIYQLPGISLGVSADASPLSRGESGDVSNLSFSGEAQFAGVKWGLTHEAGKAKEGGLTASAEYKLLEGHGLRFETSPTPSRKRPLDWSSLELGSSHQFGNLNLNPKLIFDSGTARPAYGGSLSYELGGGLRFEAEADSRRNLRLGGGYFTRF